MLACASIALALLCACSKAVPSEVLAHADVAIARGDTAQALKCCQSLAGAELTPSQLCQCALIYAKLAQAGNNPEHMASAASSLKQAIEQSPDSVMAYAASLAFADMATLNEIYSLCGNAVDENDESTPCDGDVDDGITDPDL